MTDALEAKIETLEAAQQEADLFYQISQRLNSVGTTADLLNTLADPGLVTNPTWISLYRVIDTDENDTPAWGEVDTVWTNGVNSPLPAGMRFSVPQFPFTGAWSQQPHQPLFVEDVLRDERISKESRTTLANSQSRALVIIPLRQAGRWIGFFSLSWDKPHSLSQPEKVVYQAFMHLAAPLVETQFLQEQQQDNTASTLFKISSRLNTVTQADELLKVLTQSDEAAGVDLSILAYLDPDESGHPAWSTIVSTWQRDGTRTTAADLISAIWSQIVAASQKAGKPPVSTGSRYFLDEFPFTPLWLTSQTDPQLIANAATDFRLTPAIKQVLAQLRIQAMAVVPLTLNGRWLGVINLFWQRPHAFDENEIALYRAFTTLASPVVHNSQQVQRLGKLATEQTSRANRFRALTEHAAEAIAMCDLSGRYVFANPAYHTLLAAADLAGTHLAALLPEAAGLSDPVDFTPDITDALQEILDEFSGEKTVCRQDGSTFQAHLTSFLLYDETHQAEYLAILLQDLTQPRQVDAWPGLQRELVQALASTANLGDALQLCLQTAVRASALERARLYLRDESGAFTLATAQGLDDSQLEPLRQFPIDSPEAGAMATAEPHYCNLPALQRDPGLRAGDADLQTAAVVPVLQQDNVVGLLHLGSSKQEQVPAFAPIPLETIAAHVAGLLARQQIETDLKNSRSEMERRLKETGSQFNAALAATNQQLDSDLQKVQHEMSLNLQDTRTQLETELHETQSQAEAALLALQRQLDTSHQKLEAVQTQAEEELNASRIHAETELKKVESSVNQTFTEATGQAETELTETRAQLANQIQLLTATTEAELQTTRSEAERLLQSLQQAKAQSEAALLAELQTTRQQAQAQLEAAQQQAQQELLAAKTQAQTELDAARWRGQTELETTRQQAHTELDTVRQQAQAQLGATQSTAAEQLQQAQAALTAQLDSVRAEFQASLLETQKEAQTGLEQTRVEAEASLRHAEARYRTLLNSVSNWIFSIDTNGHITGTNMAVQPVLGYTPDQLAGQPIFELVAPDEQNNFKQRFQQSARKEAGWTETIVWLRHDDAPVPCRCLFNPVRNQAGQLIGFNGINHNLTHTAQADRWADELRRLSDTLAVNPLLSEALVDCLKTAVKTSGLNRGRLYFIDNESGHLTLVAQQGLSDSLADKLKSVVADDGVAKALITPDPVYAGAAEVDSDPTLAAGDSDARSVAVVPVYNHERQIATLHLASNTLEQIPELAPAGLVSIAAHIGAVVTRSRLETELQETRREGETRLQNALDKAAADLDALRTEKETLLQQTQQQATDLEALRTEKETLLQQTRQQATDLDTLRTEKETLLRQTQQQAAADLETLRTEKETLLQQTQQQAAADLETLRTEKETLLQQTQQQAAARQQQIETRHRQLLNSVSDWVWTIDTDGKLTASNPVAGRLLGYSSDELVGRSIFDLIQPNERSRVQAKFVQLIAEQSVDEQSGWKEMTIPWLHKDGSVRFSNSTLHPVFDAQGFLQGFQGIEQDITELRQAETEWQKLSQQLRAANELVEHISTSRSPDHLMTEAVSLLQNRLGLYHVQFYRLDESAGELVLQASAGEAAELLQSAEHRIPLEAKRSLVAHVARTKETACSNDTSHDLDVATHPLLADTQAAVSVPLVVEKKLLGVLDLQYDQPHHFDEQELNLLNAAAGNLATGLTVLHLEDKQKEGEFLQATLEKRIVEAQEAVIQSLPTPIIPMMGQMITVPLIGQIDAVRAKNITHTLLKGIDEHRAKMVMIDVSGIPAIDAQTGDHLDKIVQAAQQKGIQTMVTGMPDTPPEATAP